MSKIVGIMETSFEAKDGAKVEGATIHTLEPIDPKRGVGEAVERFFISKAKLTALDFKPEVGQAIEVLYNRYGKVERLRLIDELI